MKKNEFIHIAGLLNEKLNIVSLLFGSLGLKQRLNRNLNTDDIDVIIPKIFLNERWGKVYTASARDGYRKNVKNKQDEQKIELIKAEICQ